MSGLERFKFLYNLSILQNGDSTGLTHVIKKVEKGKSHHFHISRVLSQSP